MEPQACNLYIIFNVTISNHKATKTSIKTNPFSYTQKENKNEKFSAPI